MNFKNFFKLFTLAFMLIMFSIPCLAEVEAANSLSQIVIDKPIDNSYRLSLYFDNRFQGNAFLQKRKNGSFYVFIPDTIMKSKNIKLAYKGKVSKDDVKISIEEQPYIKEDAQSRYVRLSVETPINADIQLVAQTMTSEITKTGGSFMSIYSIIIAFLLTIVTVLSVSIFKAIKSINNNSSSYTTFPSEFLNSPKEYARETKEKVTYEKPAKIDIDTRMISPISRQDFSCFDLPLKKENNIEPFPSALKKTVEPSIEERTLQSGVTNPMKQPVKVEYEAELDLPSAENLNKPVDEEDSYRPELISELKIGGNKGFYLTTVGDDSFALFGYIGEKVFFLQKFNDLAQINLQARYYDNKDGDDLYIVRLDTYKAMLAISNTEMKELAVI